MSALRRRSPPTRRHRARGAVNDVLAAMWLGRRLARLYLGSSPRARRRRSGRR